MKKNIAVVTGGESSEYVISVKSADTIIENIDSNRYKPYRVEIRNQKWSAVVEGNEYTVDKNDFSFIINNEKILFDCALIMIHGDPGEDGKLQGYLDMLKIPYTASNVLTSSATFSKHFTKQYLKSYGILSAEWIILNKKMGYNLSDVEDKIGYPCFVKPNNAGSSFGVSKVNSIEQLEDALMQAFKEDYEVLVEKILTGTEVTCGVLRTSKGMYVLPVTEIVSKTGFFDYEAKYTVGMAEEIIPARIDRQITLKCQELSSQIYDLFNCKWFARVDYIIQEGELYVLEINTIPGMSKESIVPKMLREAQLSLKDLLTEIIEDVI